MRIYKKTSERNQSGVTLVLVLAILTILTLLGVSFVFVMKTEMQAAGNYAFKVKADYLAELGLTAAKNRLVSERMDKKGKLAVYSGFTSKSLGIKSENGTIVPEVSVQDEEAKLNLSIALDTTKKDEWKKLSVETFLYSRLSSAKITQTTAPIVEQKLFSAYQKSQLHSLADLRKAVGNVIYNAISSYVTFNSNEANIDQNTTLRVNINTATAKQIYERLKNVIGKEKAARLAVNIVDFRDTNTTPAILTVDGVTYRGIETTPYINEVMPWSKTPDDKGNDGQYIELMNPSHDDIKIDGWRLEGAFGDIDLYGTVPAGGYFIITDEYMDDPDFDGGEADGYSYQINYGSVGNENLVENPSLNLSKSGDTLKLYDENGNLVDELTYGSSSKDVSWEKNDPRVNSLTEQEHGTPYGKNNAYSPPNGVTDEENIAYVADVSYKSVGDLCYVTIASPETPWMTLTIDSSSTRISLNDVIDYFTVTDDKLKTGVVNINTAPYEVLASLPGLNEKLAKEIVDYRIKNGPYNHISEVLNIPDMLIPISSGKKTKEDSTDMDQKMYNFRKLSNWISVRSYNFTIDSYARLIENKKMLAESRLQAIVNRASTPVVTVMEKHIIP